MLENLNEKLLAKIFKFPKNWPFGKGCDTKNMNFEMILGSSITVHGEEETLFQAQDQCDYMVILNLLLRNTVFVCSLIYQRISYKIFLVFCVPVSKRSFESFHERDGWGYFLYAMPWPWLTKVVGGPMYFMLQKSQQQCRYTQPVLFLWFSIPTLLMNDFQSKTSVTCNRIMKNIAVIILDLCCITSLKKKIIRVVGL